MNLENKQQITQTRQEIIASLRTVFDPELPVNIWDLGLIYGVDIQQISNNMQSHTEDKKDLQVTIVMTFTSPNCPSTEQIISDIKNTLLEKNNISNCLIDIVWTPAWSQSNLDEEMLLELGLY
jgi:metal-sulfur cluster biosynthetic enzyme